MNAFQRNFVNEVKRADEMERKLRFFETQITQINVEAASQGVPKIKIEEEKDDVVQRHTMDDLAVRHHSIC